MCGLWLVVSGHTQWLAFLQPGYYSFSAEDHKEVAFTGQQTLHPIRVAACAPAAPATPAVSVSGCLPFSFPICYFKDLSEELALPR